MSVFEGGRERGRAFACDVRGRVGERERGREEEEKKWAGGGRLSRKWFGPVAWPKP